MKPFLAYRSLQSTLTDSYFKHVIRLNPSILMYAIESHKWTKIDRIDNINKSSTLQYATIYRPSRKYMGGDWDAMFHPLLNHRELQTHLSLLDITYLDYPFEYVKDRYRLFEPLDAIYTEIDKCKEHYNITTAIDGYHIGREEYLFFRNMDAILK